VYDYNAAERALNLAEEIFITVASMTEETLTSRASPSNGIEIFYCKGPFKLSVTLLGLF
jgi:hypothetical protein